MKNLAALLLSTVLVGPALAGPCVALDYQELKDMPVEELTTQACEYRDLGNEAFSETIEDIGRRRGAAPNAQAQSTHEECSGQYSRMQRVLEAKGVSKEALLQTCVAKTSEKKAAIHQLLNRR